jgi:hypothetical protein
VNEVAKAMWDKAVTYLDAAVDTDEINSAICYTGIGELSLKMAQFAVEQPWLVGGAEEAGIPMPQQDSPVPSAPMTGPKVWGTS